MKTPHFILIAAIVWPAVVRADEAPLREIPFAVGESSRAAAPSRAAETMALPASNTLPEAELGAADKLAALKAWNAAGRLPAKNGFTRVLETPLLADLGAAASAQSSSERWIADTTASTAVWSTRLKILQAYRLRLHIENISAPAGTIFTIWSTTTAPRSFGFELKGPQGDIWTPSVAGEDVFLEARTPTGGAPAKGGFEIRELAELMSPAPASSSCLVDATCVTAASFGPIASVRKGVAQLEFIEGSDTYLCSGGLLNDTDDSTVVPYLLTANHCISTQLVAATLEATWDYKTADCDGAAPNIDTLPRSSGATLLATSAQTDFCLLRLSSIPSGRTLLGWNSSNLADGVILSRVSHPVPNSTILAQTFSQTTYTTSPNPTCSADPGGPPWSDLTKFLYSVPVSGGVFGGSSGSPLLNPRGQVVGQLLGICGPLGANGCSALLYDVDGAFSATYPLIRQYLNPSSASGPCARSATTACLANGRFEVKVDWQSAASTGFGQVMSFGGERAENNNSAFYSFRSAANFEMSVKIRDACTASFGNKYWVFISGPTNQGWTAHVRDTQIGATKTYSNALNHLTSTSADTTAFNCQ